MYAVEIKRYKFNLINDVQKNTQIIILLRSKKLCLHFQKQPS